MQCFHCLPPIHGVGGYLCEEVTPFDVHATALERDPLSAPQKLRFWASADIVAIPRGSEVHRWHPPGAQLSQLLLKATKAKRRGDTLSHWAVAAADWEQAVALFEEEREEEVGVPVPSDPLPPAAAASGARPGVKRPRSMRDGDLLDWFS